MLNLLGHILLFGEKKRKEKKKERKRKEEKRKEKALLK